MDNDALDAVKVIDKLAEQIANQAKQIAYLEVLVVALRDQVKDKPEP